jgi:hypothetical protein
MGGGGIVTFRLELSGQATASRAGTGVGRVGGGVEGQRLAAAT